MLDRLGINPFVDLYVNPFVAAAICLFICWWYSGLLHVHRQPASWA